MNLEQYALVASAVSLPLAHIQAGPNDRTVFADQAIRELAESIKRDGLAQPITVRPIRRQCAACTSDLGHTQILAGHYSSEYETVYTCLVCFAPRSGTGIETTLEIVAGERRFRACQFLGMTHIPAIVRELDDEQAAAIMLVENLMRKDIDPLDEAHAYQSRIDRFGWSIAKLAEHASVPQDRIRRRLALLTLHTDVQLFVRSGALPLGHAEVMAGLDPYRQVIALRPFQQGHAPSLRVFRDMCSQMLEQQCQDAMFDLSDLWVQQLDNAAQAKKRRNTGLRVDPAMPELKPPFEGSIGRCMKVYVGELEAKGLDTQALAISTLLDQMLQRGWTTL